MEKKIYKTANLDLAAFLMLEGLQYLYSERGVDSRTDKEIALLCFDDSRSNARDLERVFLNSEYKKYRDLTKYLLKEVHSCLKKTA